MPAVLQAQLECEIPPKVAVGGGTALFVCGWCFSPEARVRSLSFRLGAETQPTMAHGMPRLDPLQAFHPRLDPFTLPADAVDPDSDQDPHLHSYRSGFWGIVRLEPRHAGRELELSLRAEL